MAAGHWRALLRLSWRIAFLHFCIGLLTHQFIRLLWIRKESKLFLSQKGIGMCAQETLGAFVLFDDREIVFAQWSNLCLKSPKRVSCLTFISSSFQTQPTH